MMNAPMEWSSSSTSDSGIVGHMVCTCYVDSFNYDPERCQACHDLHNLEAVEERESTRSEKIGAGVVQVIALVILLGSVIALSVNGLNFTTLGLL